MFLIKVFKHFNISCKKIQDFEMARGSLWKTMIEIAVDGFSCAILLILFMPLSQNLGHSEYKNAGYRLKPHHQARLKDLKSVQHILISIKRLCFNI